MSAAADEPATQGGLGNDLRVVARRCGRGDLIDEVADVQLAADLFEEPGHAQALDAGQDVDRLASAYRSRRVA